VDTDGEYDEVDRVTAGPDRREADQLDPIMGLANAVAHPHAEGHLYGWKIDG
jgi:hypothetical protein